MASRISSMPMPVLAEQGMASVASMPITSSISALALSGSALRQVHLVEHRQHLDAEVQRGVAVGHGLRLHALAASTTSSAPSQADSERLTS
jgi:hypothetical protein